MMNSAKSPWALPAAEVLSRLDIRPEQGLSPTEVLARRRRYGFNLLQAPETRSGWAILLGQFRNLIVALLAAAAVVAFLSGEVREGAAVVVVILLNAAIGFLTEIKAVRSMEALRTLGTLSTRVRRAGTVADIPAEELVPGDIVILGEGDVITADLRILTASRLQSDESALTGESLPVTKSVEALPEQTVLAERKGMLYKGTLLTRGSGEGVVVAVGMGTELGRISALTAQARKEATPLERRLDGLGRRLIWVTAVVGAAVAAAGMLGGKDPALMLRTAIALAVATIPEGLPIVATLALARGMLRMARRQALINRLAAVETLGATSIICTDKTGTLTENRMTVTRMALPGEDVCLEGERFRVQGRGGWTDAEENRPLARLLTAASLCNNASVAARDFSRVSGDPLEVALLVAAWRAGLNPDRLRRRRPELREEAFDSVSRRMAVFNQDPAGAMVSVKGAPEEVLESCRKVWAQGDPAPLSEAERRRWLARNREMAAAGLRVLACASRTAADVGEDPYRDLVFLGLIGMVDPPRAEVAPAMAACRDAGIRVVMITGDQPVTAGLIAREVGLSGEAPPGVLTGAEIPPPQEMSPEDRRRVLACNVFARVSPAQKLELIALHQEAGAVVAMTGDGVNDAPALKKADIGVAMGKRGTQVAREAADMVLLDDSFPTIVAAVRQGRIIYDNIRAFVLYLLSCNLSEILVVGLAAVANLPLPITPLQILFLNLVTDVFPALALGLGGGDDRVMKRSPRPARGALIGSGGWLRIGLYGGMMTAAILAAYQLGERLLGLGGAALITVSFLTLSFTQLWHVFNMRSQGSDFFLNRVTRNPWVWGALLLCTAVLLAAVYAPPLAAVLGLADPGIGGWGLIGGMSLLPLAGGELLRRVVGARFRRRSVEAAG